MISRRSVLLGSVAAGAAAVFQRAAPVFGAVAQTPVNFDVPAGACDCHIHIIGDPKQYPFWAGRPYTPEPASVAEARSVHRALRTDRIIIVHPSFYGTDMSATMDGLKQLGPDVTRAVAVIDDNTSAARLDEMHRAGVRGVRLNFQTFALAGNQTDAAAARRRFQTTARQIGDRPWHIQLFTNLPVIEVLRDDIMASPVPVSIDHFGMAPAAQGVTQPGFATLLGLVKAGKAYVKVSGAYRVSSRPNDYSDVAPLAKALIEANPQRIVWGTDWPHPRGAAVPGHAPTEVAQNFDIDNGRLLNLVALWAPDPGLRKAILVDNPARLYGF